MRTTTPRKVEKQRQASRRVPVVVAQQSAKTISTHDVTALMASRWLWSHQLIVEALMIPLRMIMGEVLADDLGEEPFTQHERWVCQVVDPPSHPMTYSPR